MSELQLRLLSIHTVLRPVATAAGCYREIVKQWIATPVLVHGWHALMGCTDGAAVALPPAVGST